MLQPTNAVSSEMAAAKAEVGRKSPAARRAGSIPASGTNSKAAPVHAGAAFSFLACLRLNALSPAMKASSMCGISVITSTVSPYACACSAA